MLCPYIFIVACSVFTHTYTEPVPSLLERFGNVMTRAVVRYLVSGYFSENPEVRRRLGVTEPVVPSDFRPAIIIDSWAFRYPYPLPPHHLMAGPSILDYDKVPQLLPDELQEWMDRSPSIPILFVSMGTESQQPPKVPSSGLCLLV